MTKELVGWLSFAFCFVGYIPYIVSTLRGNTKPHAFSWIIWATTTGIVYFIQKSDFAGPGAWAAGFSSLFCAFIACLALVKGEKHITLGDKIAFVGSLAAIPLWIFTKNPLGAILLVRAIDCAAYYPTLRKSWAKPHEEMILKYAVTILKYGASLIALENVSFINAIYPAVDIVMEASVIAVILIRRQTGAETRFVKPI